MKDMNIQFEIIQETPSMVNRNEPYLDNTMKQQKTKDKEMLSNADGKIRQVSKKEMTVACAIHFSQQQTVKCYL